MECIILHNYAIRYSLANTDIKYRVVDKSLTLPWKETIYSDQDLQHHTKTYGEQITAIYSFYLYAVSLGMVL